MGYTLCVLGLWTFVLLESNELILVYPGCGTMGIAISSGVIASLDSPQTLSSDVQGHGTSDLPSVDVSSPSCFLVTCSRDPTARSLRNLFQDLDGLGRSIEIIQNRNVEAVKRADVILLWYTYPFSTQRRSELIPDSCKPYQAYAIIDEEGMRAALHGKLLISILAGVTIAKMRNWVNSKTRVIRAMPNTPCKVLIVGPRIFFFC